MAVSGQISLATHRVFDDLDSAYYHLDALSVMASCITGNRHEFEL